MKNLYHFGLKFDRKSTINEKTPLYTYILIDESKRKLLLENLTQYYLNQTKKSQSITLQEYINSTLISYTNGIVDVFLTEYEVNFLFIESRKQKLQSL